MQEVAKDIYTFSVVLPNNPLKQLNVYIIKGEDRNIIIDTGFNVAEAKANLLEGIREAGLTINDLELVLTHLHADHTGLMNLFSDAGRPVYSGTIDGDLINKAISEDLEEFYNFRLKQYGMSSGAADIMKNPGFLYKAKQPVEFIALNPGDSLRVGRYHFEIINLIGHTPGHIGLYDAKHHLLIGGDTVLDPITPNITYWGEEYPNILGTYMETLERIKALNLEIILPGHRKVITNPNDRIEEIIKHHHERLEEILNSMEVGTQYSVEDIAAQISWRIKHNNWEDFPISQKWFAVGETMSHLELLQADGKIRRTDKADAWQFSKV